LRGRRSPRPRLGRVCTTISARTPAEMAEKAASAFALGSDIVELRIDLLRRPGPGVAGALAHLARRSVMTVRRKDEGGGFSGAERERLALISKLSGLSPSYIDVELSTAEENPDWYAGLCRGSQRIVSWHDFEGTPAFSVLERARDRAASLGEVAKIVTSAKSADDNLKVLRLYEDDPGRLVAFCMGTLGTVSRLLGLRLGSPIIYASLPNEPVAAGQPPLTTVIGLKKLWEAGRW